MDTTKAGWVANTANHLVCPQTQLQTKSTERSEAELALHSEVRAARSDLDEAKRKVSRLSQENRELNSHLDASEREKETLKETVSQLEEAKRQQDRALEKLNKEVWDSFYTFDNTVSSSCSLEEPKLQNPNHPLIFFFCFVFFCLCSSCSLLSAWVAVCVLERGVTSSPGSDGRAEREGTQGTTGSTTPWQPCSEWTGPKSYESAETGGRGGYLFECPCKMLPRRIYLMRVHDVNSWSIAH